MTRGRDVVHTSGCAWMTFQRPTGVRNLPIRTFMASVRRDIAVEALDRELIVGVRPAVPVDLNEVLELELGEEVQARHRVPDDEQAQVIELQRAGCPSSRTRFRFE